MVVIAQDKEVSMKTYTRLVTGRRLVIAGVLWVMVLAPIGIATAQPMPGGGGRAIGRRGSSRRKTASSSGIA